MGFRVSGFRVPLMRFRVSGFRVPLKGSVGVPLRELWGLGFQGLGFL